MSDIENLVNFVGYGPDRPRIVFLGIEEAGGGPDNIRVRAEKFRCVEDLREAHDLLEREAGVANPFRSLGNPVQQWNTAAKFALTLLGRDAEHWSSYWRNDLGRRHGTTFLMECNAVPRKSLTAAIRAYAPDQLWHRRRRVLRKFLDQAPPDYVVCYGRLPGLRCGDLFDLNGWETVDAPGPEPVQITRTRQGSVVVKVGFFGQGRFNCCQVAPTCEAMWKLQR